MRGSRWTVLTPKWRTWRDNGGDDRSVPRWTMEGFLREGEELLVTGDPQCGMVEVRTPRGREWLPERTFEGSDLRRDKKRKGDP